MEFIFERLKVWQLAHELTLRVYKATAAFPPTERYGLCAQLRRAAAAIPTNIVEGNARRHRREYLQYCTVARASTAEVRYLLRLSRDLRFLPPSEYDLFVEDYNQVGKMLQGLINELAKSSD